MRSKKYGKICTSHHTALLRDFLFFIEMMILNCFWLFYIMHFPLTNCFFLSLLHRGSKMDLYLSKNCLRRKRIETCFWTHLRDQKRETVKGSPKGLSEEEGMTWPTLLRRLRNREMAYIYLRDLRKRRQRDTIKWHKCQFLQWDFLRDFLNTLYCISQLEIWTSAN